MLTRQELVEGVGSFFNEVYQVTSARVIPSAADVPFGNVGKELELAILFIDIRESTKIVDGFRRRTAAKMYKSFLFGVAKIARHNGGELRSFNGDGVLVVFAGEGKENNAVKAAMQMVRFCNDILKPKIEGYFRANSKLEDLNFDFGIGIHSGNVLVVRGGIRGDDNNDLVWVGNATNFAVKLAGLSKSPHHICISEDVYRSLWEDRKLGGSPKRNMWVWTIWSDMKVYKTSWRWHIK